MIITKYLEVSHGSRVPYRRLWPLRGLSQKPNIPHNLRQPCRAWILPEKFRSIDLMTRQKCCLSSHKFGFFWVDISNYFILWLLQSIKDQKQPSLRKLSHPPQCRTYTCCIRRSERNGDSCSSFELWLASTYPVVRADLLVEGGIAAALALVTAAVVARPTFLAPEMIQHLPTFSWPMTFRFRTCNLRICTPRCRSRGSPRRPSRS